MRQRNGRLIAAALAAATLSMLTGASTVSARATAAPVNTQEPTIAGIPIEGNVLGASTGTWTGTPPITYAYQWVRCGQDGGNPDGSNCATVAGATQPFWELDEDDVGFRLRVRVTATNADGSATAASNPTAVVQSKTPTGDKPSNTKEPSLTGTPTEGELLTGTNGNWNGTQPISYSYGWVRCGQDGGKPDGSNCATIGGATQSTYRLTGADVGSRIRVRVTASNSFGSATAASDPTPVVVSRGAKPANTRAPSISGVPQVGSTVRANVGTWTGTQPITYAYQWSRCNTAGAGCAAIGGAVGAEYVIRDTELGMTLRVTVTARNNAGSTAATSAQTGVVQPSGPADVIQLPGGGKSIPATSVTRGERLVVAKVHFSPNPVTTRDRPIQVRIRVKDTRGYFVRGALVFIRSTPRLTTGGDQQVTQVDGWVTYNLVPFDTFPLKKGQNVQFFVKAYRVGDPTLAGVSNRRLVQVKTLG